MRSGNRFDCRSGAAATLSTPFHALVGTQEGEEQAAAQSLRIYDGVSGSSIFSWPQRSSPLFLTSLYLIRGNRQIFARLQSFPTSAVIWRRN